MISRIKENPDKLFEVFCEVVIPVAENDKPWIIQKFPESFEEVEVLKLVPDFAVPCDLKSRMASGVQHFSFVLTSMESQWTFGFARHAPNAPTCLTLLSCLPWHETFYKILDHAAELANKKEDAIDDSLAREMMQNLHHAFPNREGMARLSELFASELLGSFLESLHSTPVPEPGFQLVVNYNNNRSAFSWQCSDHTRLPSIPENRNLTEYFNAVDANNMLIIFASMLHERRIVVTSRRLSCLSACVQAANALIYPMQWQHIYIPVLPTKLLEYLSAPMPFLVGVPASTLERVSSLKRSLKNPSLMLGEGVSRAFLKALVHLIGGYRGALRMQPGEKITFDRDMFIQSRPPHLRPFLETILNLQLFQQFIESRLAMLNAGHVFNDIFEAEVNLFDDSSNKQFKLHYREWMGNMKKEGGAFLKQVKNKANPAMKHAYRSVKRAKKEFSRRVACGMYGKVKDRGKKAYRDIQGRLTDNFKSQRQLDYDVTPTSLHESTNHQSSSAPASPTLNRRMVFPQQFRNPIDAQRMSNSLKIEEAQEAELYMAAKGRPTAGSSDSDLTNYRSTDMDLMGDLKDFLFTGNAGGNGTGFQPSPSAMTSGDQGNLLGSLRRSSPIYANSQSDSNLTAMFNSRLSLSGENMACTSGEGSVSIARPTNSSPYNNPSLHKLPSPNGSFPLAPPRSHPRRQQMAVSSTVSSPLIQWDEEDELTSGIASCGGRPIEEYLDPLKNPSSRSVPDLNGCPTAAAPSRQNSVITRPTVLPPPPPMQSNQAAVPQVPPKPRTASSSFSSSDSNGFLSCATSGSTTSSGGFGEVVFDSSSIPSAAVPAGTRPVPKPLAQTFSANPFVMTQAPPHVVNGVQQRITSAMVRLPPPNHAALLRRSEPLRGSPLDGSAKSPQLTNLIDL